MKFPLKQSMAAALMVGFVSQPAMAVPVAPTVDQSISSLAFGACPDDLRTVHPHLTCATLDVPRDYARPHGDRVKVLVSKAAATDPSKRRGVLLVNPGGPGSPGAEWAGRITKPANGVTRLPKAVIESYDVIGFDPRGVAHSTPISCVNPNFYAGPRPDPDAPTQRDAWWRITTELADSCASNAGPMLPHLGTRNVARDMDALRQALGENKISYSGASYGTYLGVVYATMFPNRIDRMILDSSIDPTPAQMFYQTSLAQDQPVQDRLDDWFAWTAQYHSVFGLGTTAAQVRAQWNAVLSELRQTPHGPVGANEFISLTFGTMYSEANWIGLANAIAAFVLRSDDAPLVTQAQPWIAPEAENANAAFAAIFCLDSPWPRDRRVYERAGEESAKTSFAGWYNRWATAACADWRVPSHARILPDGRNLPPILMFNSEGDPATPITGALKLHKLLPSSVFVTESHSGKHGVFANPLALTNPTANQIGADYLVNGTLPESDITIPGHSIPIPTRHSIAVTEAVSPLAGIQ